MKWPAVGMGKESLSEGKKCLFPKESKVIVKYNSNTY